MEFRLLARKPIATVTLNLSSTNIVSGSWATVLASLPGACTALEIFNPSSSTIQLATGSAGNEVALPYAVLPGGTTSYIPFNIPGLVRISAETVDGSTASSGYFTINFFGG